MPIRHILVPVDFSDHSLRALRSASELAAEQRATLDLLHVWTSRVVFNEASPPAVVLAAQEEAARKRLEELQPAHPSIDVRRHLGTGSPADEILRFAEAHATDVIVMGCYGRTGSTRRVLGSVAEAVTRRAACQVLTCQLPAQLRPRAGARSDELDGGLLRSSSRHSFEEPEPLS